MIDTAIEHATLLALFDRHSKGWSALTKQIRAAGSAVAVAEQSGLAQMGLFDTDDGWGNDVAEWAGRIRAWQEDGLTLSALTDLEFPARLLEMKQPPPFIFIRGHHDPRDELGVSIIGSRKASQDGLDAAYSYAKGLASNGVVVLSGLAAGVDRQAHLGALDVSGRTVAVIGTGLNRSYPPGNEGLQERIGLEGMLVSQFLPDAPPSRFSFPMRNAVMSAWGQATLVIEAGEQSGARMQARIAVEQGRTLLLHEGLRTEMWAQDYRQKGVASFVSSLSDVTERL